MPGVSHIYGTGSGKVTFVRVVRALLVIDARNELGDHEVDVTVALAVAMRRHVNGQAVHA